MSTRNVVHVDFVTSYTGANHVKKAQTDLEKLGAAAKKMAGIFGIAFAGRELVNFGKASIQAFATNEKQVALLANTMKNLGQEFAAADVNKFIDSLALASGRTKEELIPAFQGLFIATGDATKAQSALKLAMDVSAGTGKDLATVQKALSKGYLGNTTSLTRLGAGLDKATLATKNMDLISAALAKNFNGDTAIAANTFQGSMDRLKVTLTEAKVIIGTDLVQAFSELAGSKGIGGAQDTILSFAKNVGALIIGLGRVYKSLTFLTQGNIDGLIKANKEWARQDMLANQVYGGAAAEVYKKQKADAAAKQVATAKALSDAKALAAAKLITKAAQDKLKAEKDSLNLKLAGFTTDMQNIEIQAALERGQSKATTEVLLLQRAIITGNADQANVLSALILKSNGLVQDVQGNLSKLTANNDPFASWPASAKSALDEILKMIKALTGIVIPVVVAPVSPNNPNPPSNPSITPSVIDTRDYSSGGISYQSPYGQNTASNVNITVTASPDVIVSTTQTASSNGTTPILNRLAPLYAYSG